ncbi:MAG: hypothetical protein ABIL69_09735 [candidate division WOR-3 bacterium]
MINLFTIVMLFFTQLNNTESAQPIAILTFVEGEVKIYRTRGKEIFKAELESAIFSEDSIITGENSEVTIFYNNGKIVSLGPKTGMKISMPIDTTQRGGEDQEGGGVTPSVISTLFAFSAAGERTGVKILVRGDEDSLALKVIEPGNTALITNKPDFIWHKFQNAQKYSIVVQKMGNIIWQKTSTDTFLKYPEDVPELAPGSYLLKIFALKGNDTLNSAERFFKILKPEVVSNIITALNNIKTQNPDSFTLNYLSARIYEENGLILDAIRAYEESLKLKPNEPLILKSLSLLYNKYGLVEIGNRYLDRYEELTGKEK